MKDDLEGLLDSRAAALWKHFFALSAIPRCPGDEEKVRRYLTERAGERGWGTAEDDTGNVVLQVPGRGVLAGAGPLILQGHMDMVCEKEPEGDHDFSADPLRLRFDGEWLSAEGTTLGADNGIGVALAMAAAEEEPPDRVPLELLFTVDEETGLTGAMKLEPSLVRGRRLINLDSEEEGVLTIGCAGGRDLKVRFPRLPKEGTSPPRAVACSLGGLQGGHSGIDIHRDRGNAIVAAAATLRRIRESSPGALLLSFFGGSKKNAIPREAGFTVSGPSPADVQEAALEVCRELRRREPAAEVVVGDAPPPGRLPLPWAVVDFVLSLPNGVIARDRHLEGLVHTSANLGVVVEDDGAATLRIHVRSEEEKSREKVCDGIASLAKGLGGECESLGAYPGWAPNPDAPLLQAVSRAFSDHYGRQPATRGIHAGLEAGVIGALLGTGDLLSLGPTIRNAHSPGEKLHVASSERTFELLVRFLGSPSYHIP